MYIIHSVFTSRIWRFCNSDKAKTKKAKKTGNENFYKRDVAPISLKKPFKDVVPICVKKFEKIEMEALANKQKLYMAGKY